MKKSSFSQERKHRTCPVRNQARNRNATRKCALSVRRERRNREEPKRGKGERFDDRLRDRTESSGRIASGSHSVCSRS